jgi:hypothetical protein
VYCWLLIGLCISGKPEIEYQPKYGFYHVDCWLLIGISGEPEIEHQPKYGFYHVSCWLVIGLYISVGNRIENITGSMAGALLSLHHLDLRNPPTDHIWKDYLQFLFHTISYRSLFYHSVKFSIFIHHFSSNSLYSLGNNFFRRLTRGALPLKGQGHEIFDFRFFFMNPVPPNPRVSHWDRFEFF